MTLSIFISLFAVNFIAILFKGLQQKNVQHDKLMWIFPVSMVMACMEVFIISSVAALALSSGSLWSVVPMGLGAGCGAVTGILLFNRLNKEDKPE